jgi:PhnB protein
MKSVNPYLNFPGNTQEAFDFYQSVFGGEFAMVARFRDLGPDAGVPEQDLDRIMHIALPLGPDTMLMATDAVESMGQPLNAGNNFSISLEAESAAEAETLFGRLSDGGTISMPLQKTEWAEKFGACTDRFGVQWMLNYSGEVQFTPG